jgi:hypothetical protein
MVKLLRWRDWLQTTDFKTVKQVRLNTLWTHCPTAYSGEDGRNMQNASQMEKQSTTDSAGLYI